jgi:hypothetical protein
VANSLDLDPNGAHRSIEEVEAAFDINITNEEAERCCTAGFVRGSAHPTRRNWDDQKLLLLLLLCIQPIAAASLIRR